MKRILTGTIGILALATSAIACGGGGGASSGPGPKTSNGVTVGEQPGGVAVNKEAADAFGAAVSDFKKHEEARDWDDGTCASVSAAFLAAGKAQGGKFPAAHYNAGIVLLRCARESDAQAEFEIALGEAADLAASSSDPKAKADPVFHQVWVQKALIKYRTGTVPAISEAIDIIESKGFDPDGSRNVEAFVNLGMLYRERWTKDPTNPNRSKKDKFGLDDDLARAQFWLQNALSINDSFMPAYNQLALYYLDKARVVGEKNAEQKKKYGVKPKTEAEKEKAAKDAKIKADLQTLELGLLVSEEASRRDPNYAGIWNTQGLILLDMNRTGAATQSFKKATEKDAKFFEAWMNYAAINLAFRGYGEATNGYKSASGIRPKDYDAKLGLAVATRGQLDFHLTTKQAMERKLNECLDPDKSGSPGCQDANAKFPAQIKDNETKFHDFYKAAIAAYEDAEKVDANRPEAFFDQALLVEKYKAKAEPGVTTAVAYREAQKLYEGMSSKFAGNSKYTKLVEDAKSRGIEAGKSADFEEKSAAAAAAMPSTPPPAATSSAKPAASGATSAASTTTTAAPVGTTAKPTK